MVMDFDKKIELIKRNTEEVIGEEEIEELLKTKTKLKHYIGFEISGKIHLGTGLMCMSKVKDFEMFSMRSRLDFVFFETGCSILSSTSPFLTAVNSGDAADDQSLDNKFASVFGPK